MSAIQNTPSNKNFLSPLGFRMQIKRMPNVVFFLQKASLPGISLQTSDIPNPFVPIPNPATCIQFEEFDIEFIVDEDLANYREIQDWMRGIGSPADFDGYGDISKNPLYTGESIKSDITFTILNSLKQPNVEIVMQDAFPIAIGKLNFITTAESVQFVTCQARFKYLLYNITKL